MRVVLIDDEILVSDYLEKLLSEFNRVDVIGKFTNPLDALKFIQSGVKVDVVFLDVYLPEYSGLKLAKQLRQSNPDISTVFITDQDEYAVRAFEVQATDFIVKPVLKERLKKTIDRIHSKTITITTEHALQITMFQKVTIVLSEDEIVPMTFNTTKIQQLFLYLLHHRSKLVGKEQLIDLLWRDLEDKKAASQLYNAIYMIRKEVEPFNDHITIISRSGGYQLDFNNTLIDVEQFESSLSQLSNLNKTTINNYQRVLKMYTGHYLQGYFYDWIDSERYRLQNLWIKLALQVMVWYEAIGDKKSLKSLCLSAIRLVPISDEAYFYLMKMSANNNENSSVHFYFSKLQEVLNRELNINPSSEITTWYENWQRKL